MTIAIVIGTHGWAAEQLLKTAEMLLGEQENVGWIDFVPCENAETLIEKYNAQLAKLDTSKGVLFLVDTWEAVRLMLPAALSSIKSAMKLLPASTSRCWSKRLWLVTTIRALTSWSHWR